MYLFPGWKGGSDQVLVCWIRLECSPRSSCVSPWKEVSWIFQFSHLFVWGGSWIRFWLVGWFAGNIGLDCSLLSETTSHVWQNSHNSALFWHTFYFGTLFILAHFFSPDSAGKMYKSLLLCLLYVLKINIR